MIGKWSAGGSARRAWFLAALLVTGQAVAATKTVDLDGQAANGAESQCDLNVLQSFPVKIENKVTNKAVGDAYTFSWPSAGPGGFTSSITPGSTTGVGAKWTWTTNQTVYSYTGGTCGNDICFGQTAGPDASAGTCSDACLLDGTTVTIAKGPVAGTVVLTWTGGTATFTVYRATSANGVVQTVNAIGTTDLSTFTDTPPADASVFYVVRGSDCTTRKACATNADCSAPGDGFCINRGPFGVPGRSLLATDVTVSASSLTSSLITFFSPPKEVFSVTSSAQPGGTQETLSNLSDSPVTVLTQEYPPGCCPADAQGNPQLRCGDTCVDYLQDSQNCGACGNVCGDGTCCVQGVCASLCPEGKTYCNGQCVDLSSDSTNCGACGVLCGDGSCCNGGSCASICSSGDTYCGDGECADLQNDNNDCGACATNCGAGTCCSAGGCASLCAQGKTWCHDACADFQNDNANCGACGNACGAGTCCNAGVCASVCAAGQTFCNGQCVDFQHDNANCGACGNACGDGTCCNGGSCVSVCAAGQVWCNGQCVDPQSDSANCGACGNSCGSGTCCNGGTCASVCAAGRVWCNGQCVDLQDDSANCGTCGNSCGSGTCCSGGTCASVCAAGQVWCNGQCVDPQNDSANCGACGNKCGDGTCCNGGSCVGECPAGRTFCNGYCVDLQNDRNNCGSCGNACGRDDNGCKNGQCSHDDLTSFDGSGSTPIPAVCPNPNPTHPVPGYCPNPNPASPVGGSCPNPNPTYPVAGSCPDTTPTHPVAGSCPNPHPSPGPVAGVCPNADVSYGPVAGVCPNASPSWPSPAVCPASVPNGTTTPPAPLCQIDATTTTIPPGGTNTICRQGGVLFTEVPTSVSACGDSLPGPNGTCGSGVTHVSSGTFMRLVPDTTKTVGDAYLTPYAVHITDTSNDGMLEPGESATLLIDVVNAGAVNLTSANATLTAAPADLSQDGINNPVGVTVSAGTSSYGTVLGTQPTTNCVPPVLHPATNAVPFQISVPSNHPGDTSHPFNLAFTGTVNGSPFSMNVPLTIGIADACVPAANTRDFDGLDGLSSPMAKLVPVGDAVPFPTKAFSAGNSRPMKLRVLCGGANLTDATVDPPEIVGLSEATRGVLDIHLLNLNADSGTNPNDPFFRFNNTLQGGQWNYNMRTSLLGTGTFTLTIRIAGRKEYVTGFVLQ